jgi:hypothetical protein
MLQFLECGQQVRYRPAPAVQPPHQHQVDLPASGRFQQLLTRLSLRRAGANLTDLQSDRPASPGGILTHRPVLHGESLLVIGGNAGVQPHTKHFRQLTSLAKNVSRFYVLEPPFGGHFGT